MFIVTNREVDEKEKKEIDRFGKKLNPLGANELRTAEAVRTKDGWTVTILPDEITEEMKAEVGLEDVGVTVHSGKYVARRVLARVNPGRARDIRVRDVAESGKNLLLFVHGYNNNIEAVLNRAHSFETLYGVEVLSFSWPANGGGVRGAASYKSDKRDAKASIGALDRVLGYMQNMLAEFNKSFVDTVTADAAAKFGDSDPEGRESYINTMIGTGCPFTVNAIFHSMGNYLYKHLLRSGSSEGTGLLFDNVVLAAADTNNEDHASWVDRIRCRRRLYITINEDDKALAASRLKSGDEQKARLGHYSYGLDSRQGVYVQFTGVPGVGDSHAYFEGREAAENAEIKTFFNEALNGKRAENRLDYDSATNMYLFK